MTTEPRRTRPMTADDALDVLARRAWDEPPAALSLETPPMLKKSHRKGLIIAGVIALGAGGALAAGGYEAIREMLTGRAVFVDEQGNQHEIEFQTSGDGTVEWTASDGQTHRAVQVDPSQVQLAPEGEQAPGTQAPADGQPRKMILKRPGN